MALTTEQKKVVLTITGDPDDTGTTRDGVFEMVADADARGGITIETAYRTGFLVTDRGNLAQSIIEGLQDSGESPSKGFYLDVNSGQYVITVSFQGWEGAQYDGGNLQWGDDASQTLTATSATGQDAQSQMLILLNWIRKVRIDSSNPATLAFGQHTESGTLEPLEVVLEDPGGSYQGADPNAFSGSLTFVEAAAFADAFDAKENPG